MWPGMRPATGMDGELHLAAALLDQLGQLAHLVLRLGHGHAVAGHDDHVLRVGELDRGVLDRDAVAPSCPPVGLAAPAAGAPPKAPNSTLRERAVHRLAHQDREQEARWRRRARRR